MPDDAGLLSFLDLEELDLNLYRAGNEVQSVGERPRLYGGQVAAQALLAASRTVPEGRLPHSLHGYFLRAGDPNRNVVFTVDRDRDGRSFSARRVAATQGGEVIFDMAASFHVPEGGPEFTVPLNDGIAPPESLGFTEFARWHPILDVRVAPIPGAEDRTPETSIDRLWCRVQVPVGDDPVLHACLLTFMSDLGSGFGDLGIPGVPPHGPTIDHAMWFHGTTRADAWTLFECAPIKVGAGRGLYTGSAHRADGTLVAMLAQEMLLRSAPPGSA